MSARSPVAVTDLPSLEASASTSGWDDDMSLRTLRELGRAHPDAAVSSIETDGSSSVALAPHIAEMFPQRTELARGSLFTSADPGSKAAIASAWQRARDNGGARCVAAFTDDPGVLRPVYVVRVVETLGCLVVVAPLEAVDGATGSAEHFQVRTRRMSQVVDESSIIQHIDDHTREILGWDDSVIGKSTLDMVHPDDHERSITMWIEMLGTPGQARQVRLRYRKADGSWLWVDTTNHNSLDTQGCVFREVVDVNDEVEAISAARGREEVLRRLAGALPSGIVEWSPEGVDLFSNERWAQITGMTSTTLKELSELAVDPAPPELLALGRSAIATGQDLDVDITLVPAGQPGFERRCKMSLRTVADDGGAIVSAVCCLDDVTEQWELTQRLEKQASSDALTNLPNRVSIVEQLEVTLESAKRSGAMTAVMFFDLKGFKRINDRFGHGTGDELLQSVARSLERTLRPNDFVGRQGGDEFIVVCPQVQNVNAALRLAQRLQDAVTTRFQVGDERIATRASCGVALDIAGERRPERLIAEADLAMYEQRRCGQLSPGLARPEMFAEQRLELDRDEALREAHHDGSLRLFYQPLVNMASGDVIGFESLLRWTFSGELVAPDQFIDLAERRGLISDIGGWAINELCRVAAQHKDKPNLRWTINVSPLQLRDDSVLQTFTEGLERYGLQASQFGIELTEGVMMAETPEAEQVLQKLADAGFMLIVDDFGTGFASLDYLRYLPVGGLKIDRGFVNEIHRPRTRAIVASVITLASTLDMYLVAEGIETKEQQRTLTEMGATIGQGYLFGRPEPEPRLTIQ